MRKIVSMLMLLMLCSILALAQTPKSITGKVLDKNGQAVEGATVTIKGSKKGTMAGANGGFTISAKKGDVLVISAINFDNIEVTVGDDDDYPVMLSAKANIVNEVVVTALGVKREKKALGYAMQEVKGEELTQTTENNVLNSLTGKAAGVQITNTGGAVGASASIILRGYNSFSSNQPLIVVDNVPISNGATSVTPGALRNSGTNTQTAVDYGSGIQDIDPENIASISILKGANAAALYGYRAANGVILITTKTGKSSKKGIGVSYSGGYSFDNQYILPKYQNKYGQGSTGSEYWYNQYAASTPSPLSYQDWALQNGFAYVDGAGGGVNDGVDESWGPRLDIGLKLPQYNSPLDANGNRTATPWISHPNNVKDFFVTGNTFNNNVALTSNSDKGSTRLSLSSQQQNGTIPNTDQTKYSVQLNTSQNLTNKLKIDAMINYVRTDNKNLIGQGYNEFNPLQSLGSWFGRQVDVMDLKANWQKMMVNPLFPATGAPYNWNLNYHDNPYMSVYKNLNSRTKDRIIGYTSASYSFNKWFNAMVRVGNDWSSEYRKQITSSLATANFQSGQGGQFTEWNLYANELNADLMFTGGGKLSEDFSLNYTAGANYRDVRSRTTSVTANDLTVPDFFTITNAKGAPTNTSYQDHIRSNSVFAQGSLGYKSWLYLDVTARNDWSSTLPSNNWSYFYPSASLSWIFTDALGINSSILNYGKIRTSWAKVGSATTAAQLQNTFVASANTFNGTTLYSPNSRLAPQNLRPEMTTSNEAGIELHFLNNRLNLDATYYSKKTVDQIMPVSISTASGASSVFVNAGELQNKGVEVLLNLGILRTHSGLNWDMTFNWSKNKNNVAALYTDPVTKQSLASLNLSNAWATTIDAIPGQPFGVIRGAAYHRDSKTGAIVVNANGLPLFDKAQPIGNITPDWMGGINNSFTYRNFNFSFLIDVRKGGDLYSVTDMFGANTGILEYTAAGNIREKGLVVGKDVLGGEKVVKADGTPNDIVVSADKAFKYLSYDGASSGTQFDIMDGSYIKLRQIQLGYNLPARVVSKIGWLKGAGLSVFCHNVALLAVSKSNKAHIDPETAFGTDISSIGIEEYQIPSTRSVGVKLNVNF
ncbi:SusC/RagA family TonB-linked outer membrane protein [Danxiaibacter flavus]|uniref:SusC/RagA family TonB-linked outer membrane protein n=1 Tax=Danxiaibacter flavus TaxID=3049108 RepID=A0ABV3ZDP5_9BACT|nr:SusC/RagA family TonB-linked outer membrane protein [Chitinophagaceae bacterium DXS]